MDTLAIGWKHHNAGDFREADRICREILETDPNRAEAWHLLGLTCLRLERLDETESCYRKAIGLRPDFAEAHSELGVLLATQKKLTAAVESFRQAVTMRPGFADAHNNLGLALAQLGRLDEAEINLREATRLNPDHANALSSLAHILTHRQKHRELAEVLREVVRLRPGSLQGHIKLGETLMGLQDFSSATKCFRAALDIDPKSLPALVGLGVGLAALGRFGEAISCLRDAVLAAPERPETHVFLGDSLRAVGQFSEAVAVYDRAIQLRPEFAEAHSNRAFALDELRRTEEAIAGFDRALQLKPDLGEAHHNRGVALGKLARYDEALASFDRAIRLTPDYPEARRNRSLVLLVQGELQRGWEEFEWRWKCRELTMPKHPRPLWEGEPLEGRTILLHVEQGLGDTIQFIRYAALVKARGGRVVAECQKPLVPLLETCPGIDQVVPQGSVLPRFDVHTPMMGLMGIFRTTLETIPAAIPYLTADKALVTRWRDRLRPLAGYKVGVVWQGNPKHTRDIDRSFRLVQLERLARVDGVSLISLQQGYGVEQLHELAGRFQVADLGPDVDPGLGAMRDTPAIMMNLDLIVAADTSLAHLAGAMGLSVWIALPRAPDWRWLIGREDSPWYPTARLFRQTERDRWEPVFERMAEALAERVARAREVASR